MQEEGKHMVLKNFAETCKAHHLKVTPQRMAIYRELLNSTDHPSVDEMFRTVKNELPNIPQNQLYFLLQLILFLDGLYYS